MAASSSSAPAAYCLLLKAQRSLFKSDLAARAAARAETRSAFLANADVGSDLLEEKIRDAHEAAGFIEENVAQAVLNDRGNYDLGITDRHIHQGDAPPPLPCDSLDINRANRKT